MIFSSAILVALPVVLTSWTATAVPQNHGQNYNVEARDLDSINAARLVVRAIHERQAAEWAVFERDFDETALIARRKCKTSADCLGLICLNGICQ